MSREDKAVEGDTGKVECVDMSKDGKAIVCGWCDGTWGVWNGEYMD